MSATPGSIPSAMSGQISGHPGFGPQGTAKLRANSIVVLDFLVALLVMGAFTCVLVDERIGIPAWVGGGKWLSYVFGLVYALFRNRFTPAFSGTAASWCFGLFCIIATITTMLHAIQTTEAAQRSAAFIS